MSPAVGFTLIMAIGFLSAIYGVVRAYAYTRVDPSDPLRNALARRMLTRQVLFTLGLGGFFIVGVVSALGLDSPHAEALAIISLFGAPIVLTLMSVIDNVELWHLERMK